MSLTALCCTIGMHLYSHHFPERGWGQNNNNTGIYIRSDEWQAGIYRNTIDRTTVYVSYVQPFGPVALMAGLASGYQRKARNNQTRGFSPNYLIPMVGVSYALPAKAFGLTPRLFFSPGIRGASNVLHLSVEY